MAQRVLGLDIGRSSIKGVVLETSGRSFAVAGYHTEPIPVAPGADAEAHQQATQMALQHITETVAPIDQVITAIPGDIGASAVIEMPFSDPNLLRDTLPQQLDELTPFEIEDLHFDYQFIERSKGPSTLLVGSAPKEQFGEYLASLQEANVDPRVVMMGGLPYYHLFGQVLAVPDCDMWGIIDMGENQTTLTIIRKRHDDKQFPIRTEMVRGLSRGIKHLRQGVSQMMQIDLEQADDLLLMHLQLDPRQPSTNQQVSETVTRAFTPALIELRRTVSAVSHKLDGKLEHLFITGGGAQLNGIDGFLTERLGMPTERLCVPSLPTTEDTEWPDQHSSYIKSLSLALRSLANRDPFAGLNLRSGPFAYKGDLQFLKDKIPHLMIMAAILMLLFGVSIFTTFYVRSVEGDRLSNEIEKRCFQIVGRRGLSPRRCLGIMDDEILKVKGTKGSALVPPTSAYDMLLVFYQRISDLSKKQKLNIEINSLRITPKRLLFEGETKSFEAVDKIEKQLQTFRCFSKIKKGKVERSAKGDKVEFSLSATLSC
jgi:general secretion pathway protein L